MFGLLSQDDRARLVMALYQQVLVLQRQVGKRPSLVRGERLAPGDRAATLETPVQEEARPSP